MKVEVCTRFAHVQAQQGQQLNHSEWRAGVPEALSGIRVVDLSNFVFGPVASQMLGDMGAEVIKIEPPAGDPTRLIGKSRSTGMGSFFLNLNRNKKSVVLDLKKPVGLEALHKLLSTADVLVHNMRLGALKKLGLDYESLASDYPQLVHASALGFGVGGRYFDRPAYDDIIQGLSGIVEINEKMSGQSMYIPMLFADKLCGTLLYSAIITALFHRERTGKGQAVAVPMLEATVAFNLLEHMADAVFVPAEGEQATPLGYHRVFGKYHRPLKTRDGSICLIANTDAQWGRLFALLGIPELVDDARFKTIHGRMVHVESLYEIVESRLETRDRHDWLDEFQKADIPAGPAHTLDDVRCDPHLEDTDFFKVVSSPGEGKLMMTDIPLKFSASPGSLRTAPPSLGEHTRAVLKSLGYDDTDMP